VNRPTAEALNLTGAQIVQIKFLKHDPETGLMTIVVEV